MKNVTEHISQKTFAFNWNDPMHSTSVRICLPDLSVCEQSVWGDWGPMYSIELKSDDPVIIWYDNNSVKSSQTCLLVESPILAKERNKFPFFVIAEDKGKDLRFQMFLNQDLELETVEIVRMTDGVRLYHTQLAQQRKSRARFSPSRPLLNGMEQHLSYAE